MNRKHWILPILLGISAAVGGAWKRPNQTSKFPQPVPTCSDSELVRQGLAVGFAGFAERSEAALLLRSARIAQEARVGLWAERRDSFPLRADGSFRREAPGSLRGVALPMHSIDPDYDYGRELAEIAELGSSWVSLQVVTLQAKVDSNDVPLTSERTPSDERIVETIRRAREVGLEVLLLPIVLIRAPGPDDWRGTLAPLDRALWWESYSRYLLHMVDLAAEAGAAAVSVGSEMASLEKDEERWKLLIANARMRFGGYLTYSSNWDHFDEIGFWRQLDFAGMTAYFELHEAPTPTLENLESGWRHAKSEMERLARFSHSRVLFTEIGLPSLKGAAAAPWDYTAQGEPDHELQRLSFEAFGNVFVADDEAPFLGMLLYDWWGLGGEGDTNYTARGKPAAEVWRELLR